MFERISLKLVELSSKEDGQGATEYAMVIGFLVVTLAAALILLGGSITGFLGRVGDAVDLLDPA